MDSGAQVNVISNKLYNQLQTRPPLKLSTIKLRAYNSTDIPILGHCILNLQHNGKKYPLLFIVANIDSSPILGLRACERLNLIQRIHEIDIYNDTENFYEQFNDCFDEIGTLPRVHHIVIDKSVPPVVHAARKIPFALKDKLKEELDRMIRMNIIEPVTEPTEWVSQLVIVEKSNGNLRICLDPRNLNKAIKRHHYKLPTAEELFAEMSGAKYFTKLGASSGYWQIKVDEESSKLLTFATPFGRYKFNRLPFGIHSASEVFQQNIAEIIEDGEGTKNNQDDIIIWGATIDELNKRTVKVLKKIRASGLRLNKSKCNICAESVTFLGHRISSKGVSPDTEKVKAINEFPIPVSKSDLQRFLGMTAYLAKFIPNLSNETSILRELLKNESIWDFTQNHVEQFSKIKSLISRNISLKFFNPTLPTKITCDSSKVGLGATLEQKYTIGWYPIAFKSRTCTRAEQNYSPLERESLAIVFGCVAFHEYLYGRRFTVDSDHKSLKTIFNYNINNAPPRIQRFLLQLQKYDFEVKYIPGKDLVLPDTLSRAPLKQNVSEIQNDETMAQVNSIIANLPISKCKLNKIEEETATDETLQKLSTIISNGWPKKRSDVSDDLKPYYIHRFDLTVVNGLVMKGTRIVIPSSMRKEMKQILHIGHLGIERTKSNARTALFWPNINEELSDMIYNCDSCQQFRNRQRKETLIQHEIPSRVWVKVGTDLFTLFNDLFLVVVDYTSKYFEVIQLPNGKSNTVINFTKSIFSRHGIPLTVISDNGPQYASYQYRNFAKQWDFEHITSSPEYPQSNGLVERTIQTIKNTLRKCRDDESDPYLALLALRTAHNSTNSSSALSLMNRNLRTLIPKFSDVNVDQQNIPKFNNFHNQHARTLPPLDVGNTVRFRDKRWNRLGIVTDVHNSPRSYIIRTDKNNSIRRNRRDLLPSKSRFIMKDNYPEEDYNNNNNNICNDEADQNNTPNDEEDDKIQDANKNDETQDASNYDETNNEGTEPNIYKTRSRRIINKPIRFKQ